jgi:hypothetical protein
MTKSVHEQLVELLSQLGDRVVAEEEACKVHAAMLALNRGYDIGRDANGFYARPRRSKPAGPAKELRDLAAAARKAIRGRISREDWLDKWAANHHSNWRACRPSLLVSETRSLDPEKLLGFSAPGVTMVAPKPEAALPALEVALERARIAPGNRKQRKPDQGADNVISAVRSAYSALTGNRGGRAFLGSGRPGRLFRLGHQIDDLFGTSLFPTCDSTRLKRVWRQKPERRK